MKIRINVNRIGPKLCGLLASFVMMSLFFSMTSYERYQTIETVIGILTIAATTVLFFIYGRWDRTFINSLLLFLLFAMLTMLLNPYATFGSLISYCTSLMMISCMSKLELSNRTGKILMLAICAFIVYSFYYSLQYRADWWSLTHNYINSNAWGRYVAFSAIIFVIISQHCLCERKLINICVLFVAITILVYLRSRGALVCMLIFFALYIIPFVPRNTKTLKLFFFISLLFCIAMPIIGVLTSSLLPNDGRFGKSLLSGREDIWRGMLSALLDSPLGIVFGLGAGKLEYRTVGGYVHNNLYGMIVNTGIIGAVIYIYALYMTIKEKLVLIVDNKQNWLCYISVILLVFILGTTEMTSLWVTESWFCFFGLGFIKAEERDFLDHIER